MPRTPPDSAWPPEFSLSERTAALQLVRNSVHLYLEQGRHQEPPTAPPLFATPSGAFVSIHEAGRLRGCIGRLEPERSLGATLVECAISAATEDRRFEPLVLEELTRVKFEISVLSRLIEVDSPEAIEVGRHGVLVEDGLRRGVLLPQVAPAQGWDVKTLLENVCRKAGLPSGEWRSTARLLIFTALVLAED